MGVGSLGVWVAGIVDRWEYGLLGVWIAGSMGRWECGSVGRSVAPTRHRSTGLRVGDSHIRLTISK